jgi:mannose-6-phosphate isomerase-like protein (cupin superfamily)
MKRLVPVIWCASLVVAYLAGYGAGPLGRAAGQAAAGGAQTAGAAQAPAAGGALPPGDYSRMQPAPDMGEPTLFSGASLRRAHTELQTRARGGIVANPRDLMPPFISRTHSYTLVHRSQLQGAGQTPSAEQHEGVSDVYFVVGGGGTVSVGGVIEIWRFSRAGEYLGPFKGGKAFKLQAGDILNIPANTPHATVPDAGGMTYVLMKVNIGLYPWSLINGTP